ncbi:uncharacterized protein [Temnothorax longispinosus]|uniref:uncharacterized protein isoform X2 n=1 Tax=Temnothorax longispinosus TaxID=300112 RepID=UPI003A9986A1
MKIFFCISMAESSAILMYQSIEKIIIFIILLISSFMKLYIQSESLYMKYIILGTYLKFGLKILKMRVGGFYYGMDDLNSTKFLSYSNIQALGISVNCLTLLIQHVIMKMRTWIYLIFKRNFQNIALFIKAM